MHGGAYGNVTRENIVEGNNVYNTRNNAHNTIDINKAWKSAWGAQKNINMERHHFLRTPPPLFIARLPSWSLQTDTQLSKYTNSLPI